MIAWILVIVALAIFQIIAVYYAYPRVYIDISTLLTLVAALGMLLRIYQQKKESLPKKKENGLEEQKLDIIEK
jgi:hypothetical protein